MGCIPEEQLDLQSKDATEQEPVVRMQEIELFRASNGRLDGWDANAQLGFFDLDRSRFADRPRSGERKLIVSAVQKPALPAWPPPFPRQLQHSTPD